MAEVFQYWEIGLALFALIGALSFIYFCDWDSRRRVRIYADLGQKDKAELEDTFRKTTAQVIGAAAVVLVFAYTLTKDSGTFQQTRAQLAAGAYSEAVKLLDQNKDANVRAAAIYLLERVASLQVEYQEPVAYTLVAIIRAASPIQKPAKMAPVDAGIRAAVQTLGRTTILPGWSASSQNLDGTNLAGADFVRLVGFRGFRMQGADLRHADFRGTNLTNAQLSGSEMNDSAAYGPDFNEEIPRRETWFYEKFWYAAQFDCAELTNAQLDGSGLVGAIFGAANLRNTNLARAVLSRADFTQTRNLDSANFEGACADDHILFPAGFDCPLPKCITPLNQRPRITCKYALGTNRSWEGQLSSACAAFIKSGIPRNEAP